MALRKNQRLMAVLFMVALVAILTAWNPIQAQTNDPIPPEVANHEVEWPLPNRDYANTRSAVESPIDSMSVTSLGPAWTFAIPGGGPYGAAASNPVVIDQTVYFQDLASNVYAINLQDGSVRWQHDFNETAYGPNGPAVAYGKVFVAVGTSNVAAISTEDNTIVWNVRLTEGDVEGITIQPSAYDGLVYVSTVPGSSDQNFYAGDVAGVIYALDEATGEIVWQFNTVASEDLWGYAEVNSGGGAWYPPAVDTESGYVFFGTGNPGPWPGTEEFPNGTSRPGPNLYTNAMVALDHQNGDLQWFRQVLPHDLFDLDFQISPILSTIDWYGSSRDVVIGAGKLGRVFAFDRSTGELLWQTAVGQHENDLLDQLPEGETTKVLPGPLGGVETPMAMAPDGMIYVPVVNLPGYYEPGRFLSDRFNFGEATGELVAIDGNSGKIMWQADFDTMNIGAATVVNDLVFTATNDGMIYAFDRHTGQQLWSWQAPAGINGWPAVTGDMIVWPAGQGENPTLVALQLGQASAADSTATPQPPQSTEEATSAAATATPANMATTVQVTESSYNIELSTASVPAGDVTFEVSNAASDMPHELLVIRTDTQADSLPTDDSGNLMEDQLDIVGKAEDIAAGSSKTINVTLEPGHYVLVCNLPGHYSQGMHVDFTVEAAADTTSSGEAGTQATATPSSADTSAGQTVQVSLVEYAFRMPAEISSGQVTFEVTNNGSVPHNFRITGNNVDSVFDQNLEPGATQTMQLTLEPGTYDIICPVDAHAQQGMRTSLTVN